MLQVLTDWRKCILDPRVAAIVVLALIMTVLAGPFGTHAFLEFGPRLLFWSVVNLSGAVLATLIRVVSLSYFAPSNRFRAEIAAAALFTAVFGSGLVWWIGFFAREGAFPAFDRPPWVLVAYVGLITFGVLALRMLVLPARSETAPAPLPEPEVALPEPADPEPVVPSPRLLQRLEEPDRNPILWLSSQDHFVEVTTTKGSVRLRMRLKDAIAEMEGVPGHAVHRSHWVATSAIRSARKEGASWRLHLSNGAEVPVSRTCQPTLAEAGLLVPLAAE